MIVEIKVCRGYCHNSLPTGLACVGLWYVYLALFVCAFCSHYAMVAVSIPILQLRVSLQQLQVLRSVLNSLSPSAEKEDEVEESGRVQGAREGEGKVKDVSEERRVLVFQDDLRNGSLTVEEQAGEGNKSKEIRNWHAELGLRLADCCC